jgi:hypothetical protein
MMQSSSLAVEFPKRNEPHGYIRVRGVFPTPGKYLYNVSEIPGIAELLRLQSQTIGNQTWEAYALLLNNAHTYLCVDTLERAFGYLTPQLNRIYVQFPHDETIEEKVREAYFRKWVDGMELIRSEVTLGLAKKEEVFYAEIFPNTLLTRSAIDRLVPRISKILMCTTKTGRTLYDKKTISDKESWSESGALKQYFHSLRRFSSLAKEQENSIQNQIGNSLDSIWFGNQQTVK